MALNAADPTGNISDPIFDQREHGHRHRDGMFGEAAPERIGHYLERASRRCSPTGYPSPTTTPCSGTLRERAAQRERMLRSREPR